MNKTELIKDIARRTGFAKKDIKKMLQEFENSVVTALHNDEKVTMLGFGTFKTTERNPRKGRNPKTGAELLIPAHTAPVFKFSGSIKKSFK